VASVATVVMAAKEAMVRTFTIVAKPSSQHCRRQLPKAVAAFSAVPAVIGGNFSVLVAPGAKMVIFRPEGCTLRERLPSANCRTEQMAR